MICRMLTAGVQCLCSYLVGNSCAACLSRDLGLACYAGVGKHHVRWASTDDGSGAGALRGLNARLHSSLDPSSQAINGELFLSSFHTAVA